MTRVMTAEQKQRKAEYMRAYMRTYVYKKPKVRKRYGQSDKPKPMKPANIPLIFTRACLECQEDFTPSNRRQRICSDACRKTHARRLSSEYRRANKPKPEPIRFYHTTVDLPDPNPDRRAAKVAGLTGYYEANTLILMRRTGLTRAAAVSLPCGKADEVLKGLKQ